MMRHTASDPRLVLGPADPLSSDFPDSRTYMQTYYIRGTCITYMYRWEGKKKRAHVFLLALNEI